MAERLRRERKLTFWLVPVMLVAVVVLIVVTFRNSFQLERLRQQSVVEATLTLANEKADRLDKQIIEQDNTVLSLIDLQERLDFGSEWLKVADRQTPTVRAVLLIDISSAARDVVAFASRVPVGEAEGFRRLFLGSVWRDLKLGRPNAEELRHLHGSYQGRSLLVSYWQRKLANRRYLLVAWHDVPSIVHELFPKLYAASDTFSRVNVVDAEGRIVYGPSLSPGGFTIGRGFETTLYKWRLNVALVSAEELAAAVARRRFLEIALVGLSWLVVLAGLAVVLLAAARERKLSNLKSDFVANVSHELKTPLSLVRMFGELLQSGRVDSEEKKQKYLEIIVTESERLTALIENVLDFAKLEREKSAYSFAESDIGSVVHRAIEACKLRAQREGMELCLQIEPQLPSIALDERAIEIAVVNLIDNALKYAPDGKAIRVEVAALGKEIQVRVCDQGTPLPPEDRIRIFERFVRGRGPLSKRVRGSGIGLALVKHIADAHRGRAWVESSKDGGNCFVIAVAKTAA